MTTHIQPDPAFWDGVAEGYAAKPVEDPLAFERKIAITQDLLGSDAAVLDVGCGTGSLALRLAPGAGWIHGLDVSPAMVRIARGKTAAQGIRNVTFHVGAFDARLTAFAPESLDMVCAYSLLHLVGDRPATLAQLYALLKPGGAFVASTLCLGESWLPYGALLWAMRQVGKAPRVWRPGRAVILDEIRAAGFEAVATPGVGAKPTVLFTVARKPR